MSDRASEEQLDKAAPLLRALGDSYGLANFRHAGYGELVADVAERSTYFEIAHFEREAAAVLGAAVSVVPSDAPAAQRLAGRPLAPAADA